MNESLYAIASLKHLGNCMWPTIPYGFFFIIPDKRLNCREVVLQQHHQKLFGGCDEVEI